MKHTIKNRWTGAIIAESDDGTLAELAVASKADLRAASLRFASLCEADLRGADLHGADLRWADLRGADLHGADLRWADLHGADLRGAELSEGVQIIQVSGIGSSRRITTYRADTDEVWCGCFNGTLAEFRARVAEQYPTGKHRAEYDAAISFFEACRDAPGEAKP